MAESEHLEKLRKEIRAYLNVTEDVDGKPIKRRDLAYNAYDTSNQYLLIRGEVAVHLLDLNKGYGGLDVKNIFKIFHEEVFRNRSYPLKNL